jgi:hypothetical protein
MPKDGSAVKNPSRQLSQGVSGPPRLMLIGDFIFFAQTVASRRARSGMETPLPPSGHPLTSTACTSSDCG